MVTKRKAPEDFLPMGRPTGYTPEMAEKICHAISTSPYGIKRICNSNPELPSHQTIADWRIKHPEFLGLYLVAKANQALEIAEFLWDECMEVDERPEAAAKYANVFRTAQWMTAKLAPKQFGDKHITDNGAGEAIKEFAQSLTSLIKKHEKEY
ncbi:MAG: hypothetical protein ABIP54_02140 [Candidatus Andersenbacteria bacterium]